MESCHIVHIKHVTVDTIYINVDRYLISNQTADVYE